MLLLIITWSTCAHAPSYYLIEMCAWFRCVHGQDCYLVILFGFGMMHGAGFHLVWCVLYADRSHSYVIVTSLLSSQLCHADRFVILILAVSS